MTAKRIRDLLIEIAIAVVLVTAYVAYLMKYNPRGGYNWTPITQAMNTAIVFGYVIWWCRFAWRTFQFWVAIGGLLLVHAALYIFVIGYTRHLPLSIYSLLDVVEITLFMRLLTKLSFEKK